MTEANEKVEDEVAYEKKWYIIHTYSGYEKKVAADLEKRIESLDLTDRVFRILVPEEEVLEEKRGKMVKVPRKLFPSYVMIEMLSVREENELGLGYRVDSDAWYVILMELLDLSELEVIQYRCLMKKLQIYFLKLELILMVRKKLQDLILILKLVKLLLLKVVHLMDNREKFQKLTMNMVK